MTWGEQTDVPESADWYNAGFLLLWGSNVPQTRTPDAHFYTEVRYKGTKSVVVSPDYAEATKFADLWLHPKQGTDAALAMAMGHVILREFHLGRCVPYFDDYVRRYTDLPLLVRLVRRGEEYVAGNLLRASDFADGLGETNNVEWKTLAFEGERVVVPNGSIGFRWGEKGKWNLETGSCENEKATLTLSLAGSGRQAPVAFPYFGGSAPQDFVATRHSDVLVRNVPVRALALKDGETLVTTVFDLLCANYGLDRGFGGGNVARSYDEDVPFTPAWAEQVTGVARHQIIHVAREFATNAEKTSGRSMVILGAGLNHWYHMDMAYRGIINLLVLCGCIGQSGGGWSHYVGQEKLRPQTGWQPIAFGLDWSRPPRQQNATSFFYAHTDQWRYETLDIRDILSPTAPPGEWTGAPIDYNVRAERMGWLPSAPQLRQNPLGIAARAKAAGLEPADYVARGLASGELQMACHDPDDPANWPRNLFVWRSNLLGSSGKGHEYFLKHLLGTKNGVLGKDLGEEGRAPPDEVAWHPRAPEGKLDLLVTLDFRMSTTCVYSDIVLPTATWYEKNDLNTSDMHPFIHPLSAAVDPAWESRSDWEIYKGIARAFSTVAGEVLGCETDVVLTPILHDSAGELAQPYDVADWRRDKAVPRPGRTMPSISVVERDYPALYARFTAIGPALETLGNGGKGIAWNTRHEIDGLRALNGSVASGPAAGQPKLETDIDAIEAILSLAPETNGEVAVKAWEALETTTGRHHAHLAQAKEDEKIRFRDIVAQPRKIISSPTWSGIESETVCYNAGYTNVHELIPWRTLTGRQQLYQDHLWMRAFGEALVTWRPPVDTKAIAPVRGRYGNGNPEIVLNFITPHQKWGIHSTYSDNLLMLTLNRGGPVIWISEDDARRAGIADNDWIEAYNANGALVARAVVSQRVNPGMAMMYHAQEKIVNIPGSEITGQRGGIHNSVTRVVLKPTHMIGGYAHQSYGFNYYGTVGSNRDEFIVLRRMHTVDWLDAPHAGAASKEAVR
jgi:nitrate reductase alpha subunit